MVSAATAAPQPTKAASMKNAYRFERGGWIYVHFEGAPHELGYRHGDLLAPEIDKAFQAVTGARKTAEGGTYAGYRCAGKLFCIRCDRFLQERRQTGNRAQ